VFHYHKYETRDFKVPIKQRFRVWVIAFISWSVNLPYHEITCYNVVCVWIVGAFAKLRKTVVGFVMFARPHTWNNSAPTELFSMQFNIKDF
jgi:hypothetical protein